MSTSGSIGRLVFLDPRPTNTQIPIMFGCSDSCREAPKVSDLPTPNWAKVVARQLQKFGIF